MDSLFFFPNYWIVLQVMLLLLLSCFSHVPTLWNPIDGSPPGSPVPGILQARILEWVAISFSSAWKWKVKVKSLSRVWLLATPWTAAYQAPPSMGFSRQEYWSGVPLPSPSGYGNFLKNKIIIKLEFSCQFVTSGPHWPCLSFLITECFGSSLYVWTKRIVSWESVPIVR